MGGGKGIDFGFSIGAVLLKIVCDASSGLLTVSLRVEAMLACVGWRVRIGRRLRGTYWVNIWPGSSLDQRSLAKV